jgi:dipeptidyl aminopeptidase/acylaminoacyl peptidase
VAASVVDLRRLLQLRSAYAGRFDAGGTYLTFVADLAGIPQVWAVPLRHPGWPELLLAPPDRAQSIYPGPRPGQLVAAADVDGNEHSQLLYVEGPGQQWRALTEAPDHIHQFGSFTADGTAISFSDNTRTGRWFDVSVRDLASGQARRLLEDDSTNSAGPFSRDGRSLVVIRQFASSHQQLWLIDVQGLNPPRQLTTPDQPALYQGPEWSADGTSLYVLSDLGRDLAAPARLDLESGKLTYLVDAEAEVDEATIDPTGRLMAYALNRDGAVEVVVRYLDDGFERRVGGLPRGALYAYWQTGLAWDSRGEHLAISWTASQASPNVFVWLAATGETKLLTRAGGLEVATSGLMEPEHTSYPTFDGRQIPALFYPPTAGVKDPPCVVFVHGGPEGQYRPTFQPLVSHLASAGFAVLAPNVRGSSGYGKTYVHLDDVRLRMDSVADLAHAVYWLRQTGRVDPQRIAVYGGSYGGFMVLAALANYPDLWAAGVDLVGVANFVTFLQNTGPWRRHLREAEYGSLEHDRDFLEEISPINKVDRIRAPLLVIHGANDPRVPIGEAEQMVAKLRSLGRTVEFLRLEDEGHQIAKLKNKLLVYPLVADFLQRHLMDSVVAG